jgi:replicative DNA helicase
VVNIELRLLAKMLHSGNFTPLLQGEISAEHMTTEQGLVLLNFITGYRTSTDGTARFPSLSVVRGRFSNSAIDLPDPDPGDTLEALVYETQTQKMRSRVQEISLELDFLAKSSDGLIEPLIKKQAELRKMTDKLQRSKHVSLASGFDDVLADYDCGTLIPDGIPWPWPSMTKVTKGLQRGEFTIIAGRPKSRKTFVALSIAAYAVKKYHARVLIFTPEMKRKMILLRTIAFICGLRYTEFKDSALNEAEVMRLIEAARTYGKWPQEDDEHYAFRLRSNIPDMPDGALPSIDIIESTGRSVSWMESQIELFNPDIVVADSFYRQTPDGQRRNDVDHKVMTMLSRNMKDLGMNTNVVMIGTHQLNREADNKVGSLSNLGYSDAFGQDMDNGIRVITGKIQGKDVSALVMLGAREVPFEGILINNIPCADFSEFAIIDNRKTVANLLKQEDEEEAKEEAEEVRKKTNFSTKKSNLSRHAAHAKDRMTKQHMQNFGFDEGAQEAQEEVEETVVIEGEEVG